MSSSSSTLEHKNGASLTRVEVAQLKNQNPQSINSHPLMPAISSNLSISSPQNTKEEKNRLYSSLSLSILPIHYNPLSVIILSINKKEVSKFCVQNFLFFFSYNFTCLRTIINMSLCLFF